jgi:DNA-binding CsgD family transcriptional regulator
MPSAQAGGMLGVRRKHCHGNESAIPHSTRKETTMQLPRRRSILKKIAAWRRLERPRSRPARTLFLANRPTEIARRERIVAALTSPVLTPREMEVLCLVANGETDQQIADSLYVSRRTITTHVSNILAKLDSANRRQAVVTAARIGLL